MHTRPPYSGSHRRLVIGLDVGTTFSGISYAVLDPGQVPEIRGVNRFPAQVYVGGDSKIPSVLYYDKQGHARSLGAEALQPNIIEQAEMEDWAKVEWFKLHFRPKNLPSSHMHIPPLPFNKTVVHVFADVFKYLFSCAETYIRETHASGDVLWDSVASHIDFVIAHPNGWEGTQQTQLRKAAILAGLIPDTQEGHARIQFVTEGEASLNFCVQAGLTTERMKSGEGIIVVDAGGGTVDLSAYYISLQTKTFDEIAPAQCHFQGSVFVTQRAFSFLQKEFAGTGFAGDIPNMTTVFDRNTKLTFRNPDMPSYIQFGSIRDNDLARNVRAGKLTLPGTTVEDFFQPSVQCIISAVLKLRKNALKPVSTVYLVGGFAASDWLFQCLQSSLRAAGLNVCRPDSHVNKAVADGSVSFYLDHFVGKRVAKYYYGAAANVHYQSGMKSHKRREHKMIVRPSGARLLPGVFEPIVSRGVQVTETEEFRREYYREASLLSDLKSVVADVWCYRGVSDFPRWMDQEPEMFSVLCRIEANTSQAPKERHTKPNGSPYYVFNYAVILLFGPTELQAQISWKENGSEKRGPAKILYD